MTDSDDRPEDVETAVAGEVERIKRLPVALLQMLGPSGITRVKQVGDHSYEIKAWSRPVTGTTNSLVVLVAALEPGSSGTSHLRGFLVKPDQPYADLSQDALRSHYES